MGSSLAILFLLVVIVSAAPGRHFSILGPFQFTLQSHRIGRVGDHPIGFFEGTRRTVRCVGGHFVGIDVHNAGDPSHSDAFFLGIRLRCTSQKLHVQYTGEVSDKKIFGAATYRTVGGTCEKGHFLTGLQWRAADKIMESEIRIAGLTLHCSGGGQSTFRLDSSASKQHQEVIQCPSRAGPPKPLEAIDVWWNPRGLSGLQVLCGTDAAAM